MRKRQAVKREVLADPIYNSKMVTKLINRIMIGGKKGTAQNILYDPKNNAEPFWEKTAADYFAGIALAMFEDTTEDKININSINMTATVGEDKFGGSTYIKEYFKVILVCLIKIFY